MKHEMKRTENRGISSYRFFFFFSLLWQEIDPLAWLMYSLLCLAVRKGIERWRKVKRRIRRWKREGGGVERDVAISSLDHLSIPCSNSMFHGMRSIERLSMFGSAGDCHQAEKKKEKRDGRRNRKLEGERGMIWQKPWSRMRGCWMIRVPASLLLTEARVAMDVDVERKRRVEQETGTQILIRLLRLSVFRVPSFDRSDSVLGFVSFSLSFHLYSFRVTMNQRSSSCFSTAFVLTSLFLLHTSRIRESPYPSLSMPVAMVLCVPFLLRSHPTPASHILSWFFFLFFYLSLSACVCVSRGSFYTTLILTSHMQGEEKKGCQWQPEREKE